MSSPATIQGNILPAMAAKVAAKMARASFGFPVLKILH